jgi:hypothetical protein
MNNPDKLRERISYFIGDKPTTSIKIPHRITVGFKMQTIEDVIKGALVNKFGKQLKFVNYEFDKENNDYIFNYVEKT